MSILHVTSANWIDLCLKVAGEPGATNEFCKKLPIQKKTLWNAFMTINIFKIGGFARLILFVSLLPGWLEQFGSSGCSAAVKACLVAKHCTGDGEQAVCDRPEGSAVAVAACTQGFVLCFADGIVLDGHAAPVVDGVDQACLRGS